ncbi:MAG TPA: inorganic phosphate transporter [Baekduia sp.]|nr:inorganic phosphate transporter [Baekduia sp.]
MSSGLALAIAAALAFAFTNGVHDASNSIAALVATRAARPAQALALAAICTIAGPLLAGAAVADTVGGIVNLGQDAAIAVIGSGLLAAVAWNGATWTVGLPSSSGHALVGGLVGVALTVGGAGAVRWGGIEDWRPVGALGTLVALAVSPLLGELACGVALTAGTAMGGWRIVWTIGRRIFRLHPLDA